MATLTEIQFLADRLTEVSPPPAQPKGINFVIVGSGKWVVARSGAGMYAIRAEYTDDQAATRVIKIENELTGYPTTLISALKFAITIGSASTYYWAAAT